LVERGELGRGSQELLIVARGAAQIGLSANPVFVTAAVFGCRDNFGSCNRLRRSG
jgi:hypothetical protein